jgi:N-acyl amino acid synthase of PEP-CTERM/exosortase system
MIVDILTGGGRKDLLTPHFRFQRLLPDQREHRLFEEIAKLRYEVYCDECKYLDAAQYDEALETDHFDARSIHVAAQSGTGMIVGTVRLVLAKDAQEFPFEEHCTVFPNFKFPPRNECGEISRLIVKKSFRRRPGDSMEGVSKEFQQKAKPSEIKPNTKSIFSKNRRSSSPQIMLGMYREMYRYSRANDIRYWYAAMERGLAGLLRRMGFNFTPVGPETDYYGPVTTYVADLRELEVALKRDNAFMLAWFQDETISDWLLVKTLIKYKLGRSSKL